MIIRTSKFCYFNLFVAERSVVGSIERSKDVSYRDASHSPPKEADGRTVGETPLGDLPDQYAIPITRLSLIAPSKQQLQWSETGSGHTASPPKGDCSRHFQGDRHLTPSGPPGAGGDVRVS